MNSFLLLSRTGLLLTLFLAVAATRASGETFASHPPTRPLPAPSDRPLAAGPSRFVDAAKGNDANDGSEARPWKSVARGLPELKPGDTLYLRGGIYREPISLALKGTAGKPITIRGYPGELVIVDRGIPDFYEDPARAWVPCPDGAEGEFVSAKTWTEIQGHGESTCVEGNFSDSMLPLHGYRFLEDLRSNNPYWNSGKTAEATKATKAGGKTTRDIEVYCGPGTWFDAKTGLIHIRLAHTKLPGLEADGSNYKGETDPRKLKLVISGRGRGVPLTIAHSQHLRVEDLVLRGGLELELRLEYNVDVTLDGVTAYGGGTVMGVNHTVGLRMINVAFRGCSAPWIFRGHLKYRAMESNFMKCGGWSGGGNRDFEIAWSEFTDTIDGLFLGPVDGVKLHHCFLDNFSDDGIFVTAPTMFDGRVQGGNLHVYQNYIGRMLTSFAYGVGHGRQKNLPGDEKSRQTGAGVWAYRNVFDFRKWVYYQIPLGPDAAQEFTDKGRLAGDHGSPAWEPLHFYQNTVIFGDSPWRNYYAGGLGGTGLELGTKRGIFNNIFVNAQGMPGNLLASAKVKLQADGNLHWTYGEGAVPIDVFLAKFRGSKALEESKARYTPGWAANDQFADPKFVAFGARPGESLDLRLQEGSPAAGAGVPLPADYPDPVGGARAAKPDLGALPTGVQPWRIGVRGRYTMFGQLAGSTIPVALESPPVKPSTQELAAWKPIALVEGYPAFEAPYIDCAFERQHFSVETIDKAWLSPSKFGKYAVVAYSGDLARAQVTPASFSAEEIAVLKAWLQGGGTMLLTHGRLAMFQGPGMDFLSEIGYVPPQRRSPAFEPVFLKPDHPWVKQFKREGGAAWLREKRLSALPAEFEKSENLIGDEAGRSILCRVPVGKGQIIYLGWSVNNFQPNGRSATVRPEEDQLFEDQVNVLINIAASLRP